MSEVREMSFISLMSSVFLYHSGLFCAVKRWEIMRDAWAGVKGSEQECFHSANCLISARLMLCDWTFIMMRCCKTEGNTDSANKTIDSDQKLVQRSKQIFFFFFSVIDAPDGQMNTSFRNFPSAVTGRVSPLHPRLLGFLRIQTTARCSVRVKTGGSVLKDLCSHLEVHWLERTSRLVYVQLSFFKTLPIWETFTR